ncbi:uncharacterized protein LOC129764641 [Toxorhynchites rutilus septentrionalis]|uniref:uncharacterized protein LOC129764641 n=1 Tax=Toxorhynchites rutilus septentrionalis TaxID=329112 RepID=UPI002478C8F4|nr:uncharacterized protein LOC129764641 [Toxorhynchites rutilus septentrionalis]XP_055619886.1 uncharacterized protein LOC129764641 [Toxorhynchites rutilus septentrionalis]XP_055619887.1 uncharacterized protein LOC129764641 [Toxorhynchites rutilus septentrionalis]XP_055619888.1 uncharacterized protein LOC129764641 [Toxorhynchites rutilus septentrionalis]XP_055619889.1 uncharacterized protein LOC129764641 [Toxorhynchites rutilus septentrionalis]XP_055619890.1 uncharacterized protein LOC12976464
MSQGNYVSKYAGEFCKLVVEGDLAKIKSKFKDFVLDYQTPEDLNTPLHLSIIAQQNRNEIIQFLIESGADCDLRNSMNLTASELAINLNFLDVTKFMLAIEFRNLSDYRCFYRLIRRGSVPLLQLFLELKSFDVHQQIHFVSSVWHELYVKNVQISKNMENFLEYQLLNYSYAYHHPPSQKPDRLKFDKEHENRIDLIVEYTRYLTSQYATDNLNDFDDKFLLAVKIIYDNLFFIKDKHEFAHLPMVEMERCLAIFLAIFKKSPEYEIYKLIINKRQLLVFLAAICDELDKIKKDLLDKENRSQQKWTNDLLLHLINCIRDAAPAKSTKAINALWKKKCPLKKKLIYYVKSRLKNNTELSSIQARMVNNLSKNELEEIRGELKAKEFLNLTRTIARKNFVIFKRLKKTSDHLAQLYAIKKILRYLDGIARVQLPQYQVSGVLAIKRTLQVLADTVSSTKYSPRIRRKLDYVVHKILPLNLDLELADYYTPNVTLYKLCSDKLENRLMPFAEVQCSLKSVRRYFACIFDLKILEAYKCYLGSVYQLKDRAQVRSYNQYVGEANRLYFENHTLDDVYFELEDCIRVVEELQETFVQQHDDKISDLLRCIHKSLGHRYETLLREGKGLFGAISSNFNTSMLLGTANQDIVKIKRIVRSFLDEQHPKYDISTDSQLVSVSFVLQELLHLFTNYLYQYQMDERVSKSFLTMVYVLNVERYFAIDHLLPLRGKPYDSLIHQNYTNEILKKFNLQNLSSIEFAVLHEQLAINYYDNCFNLDKKYAVMTMFMKTTNRAINDAIMKRNKRMDREEFQSYLESKLKLIGQFLPCSDFNEVTQFISDAAPHVEFALECCLLEICEILTDLNVFQDNSYVLKLQSSIISGRNLREYLLHDPLAYDMLTLTHSTKVKVFLNGLVFKSNDFKLYQPPTNLKVNVSDLATINDNLVNSYKMKWSWVEQQERLFKSVENIDLKLLQALTPDYADVRGMRLGALQEEAPIAEYEIIDYTIKNNLRTMTDFLAEDVQAISFEKQQFFQYLLVRSFGSLFVDAHISLTGQYDRQAAILYMALYFRAYEIFLDNVRKFELSINLSKIAKYINHEFIDKIAKQMKDISWNCQDENGVTVLDQCIQKGDVQAVKKLLKLNVDVNQCSGDSSTGLHRACSLGLNDIVRLLVKQNVQINAINEQDYLPLTYAIQYHENELIPMLVSDEIDVNSERLGLVRRSVKHGNLEALKFLLDIRQVSLTARMDQEDNSLIHMCAIYDRDEILRFLIANYFRYVQEHLNEQNCHSKTALHIAVSTERYRIVELLLQQKASVTAVDQCGLNAVEWALERNSVKLLKLFVKYGFSQQKSLIPQLPLALVIEKKNIRMLKLLNRIGYSLLTEQLCLIKAVYAQSVELVKFLVESNKIYLSYKDPYDSTALHVAIAIGCNEIAAFLIESGSEINAITKFGDTPLHVAAKHCNIIAARMLILKYAAIDERNSSGLTPLMQAMYSRNLDIMKLLIGAGANIELLKIHLAEIEQMSKIPTIHMFADNYGLLEFMILQLQYDPNVRDGRNQQNILHKACYSNNLQIVQFLVDWCRVQVEQQDSNSRTPLSIANECKNFDVAEFLRGKKRKKSQITPQRYFDPSGMM